MEANRGIHVDETDTGTDPDDPDSDDGTLPDGWEVDNGLDPNDDTGDNGADTEGEPARGCPTWAQQAAPLHWRARHGGSSTRRPPYLMRIQSRQTLAASLFLS